MHSKIDNPLYPIAGLIVMLALVIAGAFKPIGDFGNYYYASIFMSNQNGGSWLFDALEFNLAVKKSGEKDFFLSFAGPPLIALIYSPFTWFDSYTAKILWNIINVLLLIVTLYSLQKHFQIRAQYFWASCFIFLIPLNNNVVQGQGYFLLFFLIWFGYKSYYNHNKWLSALLWAIALHVKVIPGLLCLIYLFNKDLKSLFIYFIVNVTIVAISLPFIDFSVWINYITEVMPLQQQGYINDPFAIGYQSADVLLRKLFVFDDVLNPTPWYPSASLYACMSKMFKLLILTVTCIYIYRTKEIIKQLGAILISMMLISGYGNSFSLLLLFIPLCVMHTSLNVNKFLLLLTLFLVAIICYYPYYRFLHLPLLLQFLRLYLLIIFFLVYLKKTSSASMFSFFYLIVFLSILWPFRQKEYSKVSLDKQPLSLLACDVDVSNNKIIIKYFNQNGISVKEIKPHFKMYKIRKIFDEKGRKAFIVNGTKKICLSDVGRGKGFYRVVEYDIKK